MGEVENGLVGEALNGGLGRLWPRRGELFGDIRSSSALWHAIGDSITLRGEGNEWVNIEMTAAFCDFLYDPYSPAGIRSPAQVTDEELAAAGVSREQLEYWVARERIAIIDGGVRVDHVIPQHNLRATAAPRARRLPRCAPRSRATSRRVRRVAREPDDPSRPRPSPLAAASQRRLA